jgi:hypothetical protein
MAQDQKPIGMLTGVTPDYGSQRGRTFPTYGWSVIAIKMSGWGVVRRVALCLDYGEKYIKMDVKTSFFDILSEVQKDSEDVSAGIGFIISSI